ncbi:hypothetical protein Q4503_12225 [Colwellia sp. 6_MG-2023]|uniref:type I restriction endonuclease subunit R, EcoR124 family n=1 Tax=Colwellia sp. 6_MG-2023 TaxID=3062676 RepID=UPI0026E434C1|nr:hypothetical protein [Colwellia sp. 6_MG-2023]MDO6488473.1 hypothetical protein [Colwellia sp. 6_MG-2023]
MLDKVNTENIRYVVYNDIRDWQRREKANIIDAFFKFAQAEQQSEADELIKSEGLNIAEAKRYISTSSKREYASENGTELNSTLPKMSPLNPQFKTKKQTVFQKIAAFIEKFKGVGGKLL